MIPKPNVRWSDTTIALDAITKGSRFQVRLEKLNLEQVDRYALRLQAGDVFPPIQVAKLGKELHVVDGHHRLAAHRAIGANTIKAQVGKMTVRTAALVALYANVGSSLALNRSDSQTQFRLYYESGNHLKPSKATKSYRQIASELEPIMGRHVSPTTVSRWLGQMKPQSYDGPLSEGGKQSRFDDGEAIDQDLMDDIDATLAQLARLHDRLPSVDARAALRSRITYLATDMGDQAKQAGEDWIDI